MCKKCLVVRRKKKRRRKKVVVKAESAILNIKPIFNF